jgi:chromosome segregation protein
LRLRSLDIKGFKSFADKTQVLLDHPITGIVGPNGCGKSNIVDAIRWVIGEHKIKALRSDNLEDLIFNGSRTRSASGMAEVSLTFENTRNLLPTEFTTVTITRKFYKNGESEYRLNDVACRLKDIHNLFLDTGVSNDSYAIIELGMVDDIIKDKEGSRRRMLEQAAGISIYKTRKKEAKQKLDATEADLARIDDLLFEIASNLRTLENQAKKAERYYQIRGEYKEISIELAKASLEHFNDQYRSLNEQHERETDRKTALEATVATAEAAIEKDKVSLIAHEQELNGMQKAFNELLNRVRHLEGDKRLAAQKLEHLRERSRTLTESIAGTGQQLGQLQSGIVSTTELLRSENAGLDELRGTLDQLRRTVEEQRAAFDLRKRDLDAVRGKQQQAQRRQFDADKKVAVADSSAQNIQRSIQHLEEEAAGRANTIAGIIRDREAASGQLQQRLEELQELQRRQDETKSRLREGQAALEGLRAGLVEENRKLDARRNEHDLLRSLVDSLEGFPDSIKFLKRSKDWGSDAPLLSDVFVVNPEYRVAIEAVLEPYLNYFIAENIEEAARAVRLLERDKKGKANFFLLDRIPQGALEIPAVDISGAVRALEVIEIEQRFQALAEMLLGDVLIVSELHPETVPEHGVIVDKAGRCKSTAVSLNGGSVGLFEGNKIGRAKNLERLAAEITALNEVTAGFKTQISTQQSELARLNAQLADKAIESTRQETNRLQNSIANFGNRIETYEGANRSGEKRMQELQAQLGQTQDSMSGTRRELEGINAELQLLNAEQDAAGKGYAESESAFNAAMQHFNAQNLQFTKLQSRVESLRSELSLRSNQLDEAKRQLELNREALGSTSIALEETEKQLHSGDAELYNLMQRKDAEEKELNEKDRSYYEFRNAVTAAESALSQKRREKEQVDALLNGIKEKLGDMRLQLAGMKERLQVEFKVSLDEILEQPRREVLKLAADAGVDELRAEADRLKKRIESLGEVNPTAIEAFTEVKARHDFIVEQKTDLVDAKDSLRATIEEVEQTANARFRETFDAVRANFVDVFKALFTEDDNADLRLTDPDNIAESGIEIYAQPKGKRPSTLTQLSGGEKTLTSTAFLFAIYLIKPAPFCILDEVDAPLDDANVGKFTNMIRKFSDNSQFIIVTHNKQTMAAVDVIYGVTMQEPGVSKLVPVDFRSLS